MRFRSIVVCLVALVVVASALHGWLRRARAPMLGEDEPVAVPPPAAEETPVPSRSPPAPGQAEVQPTLDRAFGPTLTLDPATERAFLAGDFNGDGAADLAAVVRPRDARALARLNAELSRWSVQDASAPATDAAGRRLPVKVAAGDLLLAVVHGVDGDGWRHPDARQGYLVKNAAGTGLRRRPLSEAPPAIRLTVLRTHLGDVIAENRGGEPGLILWNGAAYVWADLDDRGNDAP
jgi:hypothetical protein